MNKKLCSLSILTFDVRTIPILITKIQYQLIGSINFRGISTATGVIARIEGRTVLHLEGTV
jgi:hypothetical protein